MGAGPEHYAWVMNVGQLVGQESLNSRQTVSYGMRLSDAAPEIEVGDRPTPFDPLET